ncbi:restin homolog isoform X1 [Aricia agestis]|uniref:restin homolog isoform X1 n=1 Tax=Aricia agestis TaxID=91739 RepID=UPI001C20A564|nr:restin homolog isoform X1 [Aricia agestis]
MSKNILSSHGSTTGSDDSFITPVSSVDDLMALSPKKPQNLFENSDVTSDFLTGMEFDSICDVTMQEIPVYDDNMLIDGTSLDYLAKCAGSNRNQQFVDRGKESLFVKFDPLYANQKLYQNPNQNDVQADSLECDVGYETGSSTSAFTDTTSDTPKMSVSNGSVLYKICGKDKPTQVVPPVVTNEMQKQTAIPKPTPTLMRSVSAILTPTQVTTDRLISISGSTPPTAAPRSPRNKSFSSQEVDRLQSLRIILQNQDQEVLQLRQENRALKSSLQENQHQFDQSKEEYETKLKKLTDEKESFQARESDLLQQVKDKTISNKQMCLVMEEYEKTISILIADQEKEKLVTQETINNLIMERDDALKHLTSMESSFNDLLAKYEKCKSFVIEAKEREKILENKIAEYEVGMQKYDDLYNNLKKVTAEKLDKANETLDNLKKSHNVEIMKLNATIKKHEVLISSLQAHEASISSLLAQKTRDNEELTRICDQLINEVR